MASNLQLQSSCRSQLKAYQSVMTFFFPGYQIKSSQEFILILEIEIRLITK